MNIIIWVLQGIIALMFLMAGLMKVRNSKAELKTKRAGRMDWVEDLTYAQG